jgi:hypothetical protein
VAGKNKSFFFRSRIKKENVKACLFPQLETQRQYLKIQCPPHMKHIALYYKYQLKGTVARHSL